MSDREQGSPADDEADLAAEFVLGLQEGSLRSAASDRLRTDPGFRVDVEAWERRLAPLLNEVAPVTPPASSWARISAVVVSGSEVVALAPRPRPWNRLGRWRIVMALSTAAAAVCLAVIMPRPARAPRPAPTAAGEPVLTATLSGAAGKPLFVATLDRSRGSVAVMPVGPVKGHGRFPELWIIPVGGKPKPVGMVETARPFSLVLTGARERDVLAVSLEPASGSATGAPTGPVIATGALKGL